MVLNGGSIDIQLTADSFNDFLLKIILPNVFAYKGLPILIVCSVHIMVNFTSSNRRNMLPIYIGNII